MLIPTNMARPVMDMLIRDGKVSRGYLGVNIGTATPQLAKQEKLGTQHGALVAGVDPNGPAARAGLTEGDVVVALNGTEIRTGYVLRNAIAMTRPGTTVDIDVIHRGGAKATLKAKLGELPADNVVRVRPAARQPRRQPQQQQQQWP